VNCPCAERFTARANACGCRGSNNAGSAGVTRHCLR
jgi:hypothetical protein